MTQFTFKAFYNLLVNYNIFHMTLLKDVLFLRIMGQKLKKENNESFNVT